MAILGIDEAGRGPLAGPLVVGAVILPDEKPDWVRKLADSKKLTAKKRERLSERILAEAVTGLGWVSAAEIDELGMSEALRKATRRAVKNVRGNAKFSQIIIDGNQNFLVGTVLEKRVSTLVKADATIKEVSAASIIAKVARDQYMCELAERFPEYGFEKHKGYGTAMHMAALQKWGPCAEHRRSFRPVAEVLMAKKSVGESEDRDSKKLAKKNTTEIGSRAEEKVAEFLVRSGHKILARNWKTQRCEIDIVSVRGEKVYFTEVKYRRDDSRGGGKAAVTPAKKRQMEFAVEIFLQKYSQLAKLQPVLAVADVAGEDFAIRDWVELAE